MTRILFVLTALLTLPLAHQAQAQSSAELSCKAQAKEVAVQTYSNCMTETRNSQIEQIRKSYKEDLAAMKSKYDRELKKISGGAGGGNLNSSPNKTGKTLKNNKRSAPSVSEVTEVAASNSPKATKGIARSLPTREATTAAPIKSVTTSDNGGSLEREAADAEGMEIVPMPEVDETPAT